ncbi:helix-turn-helix transcriptional regulator [Eubacterium sp.]|uniref:helix-turn-helix domain-containing protein n=1 Tax=Eubacterium sp. TaxID=142586 RepID=UPI0025C688AC|nr:helix-turn-helix transcriptional regulator [Eubacterium sp.]MCI7800830.1 helix-turn-helix domain-containing protein [Eubacterium sp.]
MKKGALQLQNEEFGLYNNNFDINERKELIAESLRELRVYAGLTQSELADKLGIKAGTYSTYENGTREAPAEIIVRLSILYGVSTDIILQVARYKKEQYVSTEQIENFDSEIEELRKELTNKKDKLNPEVKMMLETMTTAFENVSEQLKAFNENTNNK